MDISSYKSSLSLVNFLNNSGTQGFSGLSQSLMNALSAKYQGSAQAGGVNTAAGDLVQLSDDAKNLLAQTGATDDQDSQLTGVQKAAQNFLVGFFDESGVDLESISPQAVTMIKGLQDIIADSGVTGRDVTTDRMEMSHNKGERRVYTLTGTNTRLRLAIQYADDKKTPLSLTMTDINGGKVETAEISLAKDDEGVMKMNIDRSRQEYANGHRTGYVALDPIALKFYK